METIDTLKLMVQQEKDRWVVLMGYEVATALGESRLQPALVVGKGPTKDSAKYDATRTLREFARRIDWGTL